MPKGTSRAEATLNSEKNQALAIIKLCLTEGISQSGSQSEENSVNFFFKFHGNFLKAFQVDLKACLGVVLLNQYYTIVIWEN